jgi:propanol-preferring alcohol dehydrogenase
VRAYRLLSWGEPPELVDVAEQPVPEHGVVINVGGSGVCHSDLHLMRTMDPTAPRWPAPFTLGHETAGWVAAVGAGVTEFAVGDAVAVLGSRGCGACSRCAAGDGPYCHQPSLAPAPGGGYGLGLDGGMADQMLIAHAEDQLVRLPENLSPDRAAPLTDAALTSYRAVETVRQRLENIDAPTVLVIGVGGLGRFVVQLLTRTTRSRVIAVEPRQHARVVAESLGATALSPDQAESALGALVGPGGFDVVFDVVNSEQTTALSLAHLRPGGELLIVGGGGARVQVGHGATPPGAAVRTIFWGGRSELKAVVDLAARGVVDVDVQLYPLSEVDRAYNDLGAGLIAGRAVVVPD